MKAKSDDISIRTAVNDDAGYLLDWWNDGEIMAHAGFPDGLGISREEIEKKIQACGPEKSILIIEAGGVPVGEMNYKRMDEERVDIGIKICNSHRRNAGIGTKAIGLLLSFLFEEEGYPVVILDTNLTNTGAQRFYERIGFSRLGVRYDSWTDQNGRSQSAVDYELSVEKWRCLPAVE